MISPENIAMVWLLTLIGIYGVIALVINSNKKIMDRLKKDLLSGVIIILTPAYVWVLTPCALHDIEILREPLSEIIRIFEKNNIVLIFLIIFIPLATAQLVKKN